MSVFSIGDEEGRITSSNKVYDVTQEYVDRLHDAGLKFVRTEQDHLASLTTQRICRGKLCDRPVMCIVTSKRTIKAGGVDTVVFTGAPRGASYSFDVNVPGVGAQTVQSGKLPDGELEIGMDMPCLFTVHITKWPHQDFVQQIEAVA